MPLRRYTFLSDGRQAAWYTVICDRCLRHGETQNSVSLAERGYLRTQDADGSPYYQCASYTCPVAVGHSEYVSSGLTATATHTIRGVRGGGGPITMPLEPAVSSANPDLPTNYSNIMSEVNRVSSHIAPIVCPSCQYSGTNRYDRLLEREPYHYSKPCPKCATVYKVSDHLFEDAYEIATQAMNSALLTNQLLRAMVSTSPLDLNIPAVGSVWEPVSYFIEYPRSNITVTGAMGSPITFVHFRIGSLDGPYNIQALVLSEFYRLYQPVTPP